MIEPIVEIQVVNSDKLKVFKTFTLNAEEAEPAVVMSEQVNETA